MQLVLLFLPVTDIMLRPQNSNCVVRMKTGSFLKAKFGKFMELFPGCYEMENSLIDQFFYQNRTNAKNGLWVLFGCVISTFVY